MQTQEERIRELLTQQCQPKHLEIYNESSRHGLGGDETHFKVVVVSEQFNGLKSIKRHQAVNRMLLPVFEAVHAISLQLFTSEEWKERGGSSNPSPDCRGGSSIG